MQFVNNYLILLPLTALFIALFLMVSVRRYRTKPIATTFLALMSALAWWSLTVILEHASLDLPTKVFWVKMSYFGIVTLPPAWVVFTLQYANREKWLTRRNLAILTIMPVITLAMVWTNDIYHLMWKDIWLNTSLSPPVDAATHNIGFWVQAVYAYLLLLLGTLILLNVFLRSSGIYRKQVGTMLLAAMIPWVGNFLFIAGVEPFSVVDPTPLAFTITGIVFWWGLSRLRLLDVMPIAHEAIFRNMTDGVIVVDVQSRITDINPAAERILGLKRVDTIGRPYSLVSPGQADLTELKPDMSGTPSVISMREGQTLRYYVAHVSPINMRNHFGGHLVLLHDDTERRKADVEGRERVRLETELIERKRAEQQLRQSEEKYSTLVEKGNDGVVVVQDGLLVFANSRITDITGFSLKETLRKPFVDFLSPEYIESMVESYKKRMAGEELPNRYEIGILAKDGRKIPIEINASRIEYEGRAADMAIIRDISERKQAEEALKESEAKYRTLVERLQEGVYQCDLNGTYVTLNDAGARILGFGSPEQAIGKFKTGDLYYDWSDRAKIVDEIGRTGRFAGEVRAKRRDGSVIWLLVNNNARLDGSGNIVGYEGTFADVTERKKMEYQIEQAAEEWRTTFDSITDLVSIIDNDFKLVRVNRAFADTFGKRPKELIGKPCYEVVHKTNEPMANCPHQKTLKTKKSAMAEFFEPTLGIYLEATTAPIFNEKGEIKACVQVARDVTKRKRMQEQLMLTDRLASIGELASGIAHELNNPLTSVIGFAQLLMEKEIPEDVREDLGLICSEAQRSAGVVKNLLTFARKHAAVKQLSQINNIIEDVLRLRAYEQKVNNIEVEKHFAPNLPEMMVDYFQMQQVFLNIIINAEYFMIQAHNRGTLTITTERLDSIIRISFADDGPGISKENLRRLFNPFFTTKDVGQGTGLGLSICHGIVAEHGGRIYARSQLGKGATFVVELPIKQQE
jgi:PAS domain S-box-containing protein